MALANNNTIIKAESGLGGTFPFEQATGATIYNSAGVAGIGKTAASLNGKIRAFASANDDIFLGLAAGPASLSYGFSRGKTVAPIATGPYIAELTVTGLAGTDADRFKDVWLITDDNTFTLTDTAKGAAVGVVVEPINTTKAKVFVYGLETRFALGSKLRRNELLPLPPVTGVLASTGNVKTGWVAPFACEIISVGADVIEPINNATSITYNLEIDGTNVTGGNPAVTPAAAAGTQITAVLATANNIIRQGSLIDVEATLAGSASTVGLIALNVLVKPLFGN